MAPVVDRLKAQYTGKVDILQMNVEKDQKASALANQFGAQYVPTFVFLNANGSMNDTVIGETSEAKLKSALDALK